jgi:hypothetical protein
MAAKLTADPDTRIITVTCAPTLGCTELDVVADIYSPLKVDWLTTPSLQVVKFPFRTFGDPKSTTEQIGPFVFIDNISGWRMQPYDDDHELLINGNLIAESDVAGLDFPLWLKRTGRTIALRQNESAQALTSLQDAATLAGLLTRNQFMALK